MGNDRLPSGVTGADIDKHFGGPDSGDLERIYDSHGGPNDMTEKISDILKSQLLPDDEIREIIPEPGVGVDSKQEYNLEFQVLIDDTYVEYRRETTQQDVERVKSVLDSSGIEYERVHRPDTHLVTVETKHVEMG